MSQCFWPIGDAAQADYEALRTAVLAGTALPNLAAARFARRGLAGLIAWPVAEPIYSAILLGAQRPAWTPYADVRVDALAAAYELLLSVPAATGLMERIRRCE